MKLLIPIIKNARFETASYISRHRSLYIPATIFRKRSNRTIGEHSDLIIEGFPRSGNSFIQQVLRKSNPSLRINGHTHAVATVCYAVSKSIPILILIRHPLNAIISLRALSLEAEIREGKKTVHQFISLKRLFKEYQIFYQNILSYCGHIVILKSSLAINDPLYVVSKINNFYNMNLQPPSKYHIASVSSAIGYHGIPNRTRNLLKSKVKHEALSCTLDSAYKKAEECYFKICASIT